MSVPSVRRPNLMPFELYDQAGAFRCTDTAWKDAVITLA